MNVTVTLAGEDDRREVEPNGSAALLALTSQAVVLTCEVRECGQLGHRGRLQQASALEPCICAARLEIHGHQGGIIAIQKSIEDMGKIPVKRSIPIAFAVGMSLASTTWGCSICRCGDPTFNALGKEGIVQSGLRLALDWDRTSKTQGLRDEDFSSVDEDRLTFLAAWGISDRWSVFARVPYSSRDLTEIEDGETEHQSASGLSDPEIYAQVRLWSSPFEGDVGNRASIYFVGGVKTDWGENEASRGGERLDEHVQPGTGSTDWFMGLSASYQINPRSALFGSFQYRDTGRNDFGYQYGDISLINFAFERKLSARWDSALELNYRDADYDLIDATNARDPDTGGSVLYLTPRILFDAGGGWVWRASAQIPVSESGLHGVQDEKPVLNVGVTRLLGK